LSDMCFVIDCTYSKRCAEASGSSEEYDTSGGTDVKHVDDSFEAALRCSEVRKTDVNRACPARTSQPGANRVECIPYKLQVLHSQRMRSMVLTHAVDLRKSVRSEVQRLVEKRMRGMRVALATALVNTTTEPSIFNTSAHRISKNTTAKCLPRLFTPSRHQR